MRGLVVAIAVALLPPLAEVHADPTQEAALLHLDRGVAAFRARDFARALRELQAAHDLAPNKPNPYRWLALTQIQLGDCAAALPNIDGFLSRVPADDERVPEMTRWRELCRREPAPQPQEAQVTGTQGLAQPRPPPREDRSITQRWWFWPAIGISAIAITGAVVYVATDRDEAVLPPIRCDLTGCRP